MSKLHRRNSIRLQNYDYCLEGMYYVTICTQKRLCCFGEIIDGVMQLNDTGRMVHNWWLEISNKFTNISLDEFVVMPNHLHGIIIVGADLCVCPDNSKNSNISKDQEDLSLYKVIQWFKTMTTNQYIRMVKSGMAPRFEKRFWQRNYYEHVIRNEDDLFLVRKYIKENPLKWNQDEYFVNVRNL